MNDDQETKDARAAEAALRRLNEPSFTSADIGKMYFIDAGDLRIPLGVIVNVEDTKIHVMALGVGQYIKIPVT